MAFCPDATPGVDSLTSGETLSARAAAALLDWAGLVRAAAPWVRLIAQDAAVKNLHAEPASAEVKEVLSQVDTVLEVLQAIGKCTMECTMEKDAMVTHSFMEVRDVE